MSALSDLAAELGIDGATLAARLTVGGDSDEALQTSYLSVNPDGTLGALSFSGRTAQGGIATAHWSSGNISDQITIQHGLGAVPTAVTCTAVDPSTGITVGTQVDFEVQNRTTQSFDVRATQPSGGLLANLDFHWIAISGDRGLLLDFATGQVGPLSGVLVNTDVWHNLPLGSNWTTSSTVQYYSDGDRVWFRGDAVNNGVYTFGQPSGQIGTLPAGAGVRPVNNSSQLIVPYTDASNGNGFMFVNFNTDGSIALAGAFQTAATGNPGSRVKFTGASFRITE